MLPDRSTNMTATTPRKHTFIVEHLDDELEEWQALEYKLIYQECHNTGSQFILSGLADPASVQKQLNLPASSLQGNGVETIHSTAEARQKVCLLDPKAEKDISPEDAELFDAFLFGGILGDDPPRGTTHEPRGPKYAPTKRTY